ncbi:MAG: 23S rRNA (pseudouridine(1915)-N(3))-methyltransferase RlmH [Zetaproteobacteria bacterium]|nr:23S rRNA (pseudouridine(1915)-N(3))-methyltransferase RlmH [Zetaproteobacteria bacterium]
MKLRLFVVGKMVPELAAYEARFCKRLSGAWKLDVIELPEGRSKQLAQRKQEEEKHILKAVKKGYILFDEHGQQMVSKQWSTSLQQLAGNATQDFVIGGAAGVSDMIRQQARKTWGLSQLTLPHQMARVMVVEQLYRAWSIAQGHPYHRE